MAAKKNNLHYVNHKEFKDRLRKYYETDIITDQLAMDVAKIAEGLSFAPNFINYSYKEEMVGDAKVKMFKALHNKAFNVDSPHNPFSYFTTIAFHAFITRIKKEKRYNETLNNYQEHVFESMVNDGTSGKVYVRQLDDTDE
jgi:hypothetical protein